MYGQKPISRPLFAPRKIETAKIGVRCPVSHFGINSFDRNGCRRMTPENSSTAEEFRLNCPRKKKPGQKEENFKAFRGGRRAKLGSDRSDTSSVGKSHAAMNWDQHNLRAKANSPHYTVMQSR